MSHALTLLVAPVIMEANEGSGVSGLLEEKDLLAIESYFGPKFNALSERFGSLEEKLIPHEAMEIVEDRVDDLEDHVDGLEKTVGFHTQQIDELKKAQ